MMNQEEINIKYAKQRKYQLITERITRAARKDPEIFINYSMSFNAPSFGPNKWYGPEIPYYSEISKQEQQITCQMHYDWQNLAMTHDRLFLEGPREHAKTQRMSIGRVIWELGINPDIRIKIVSQIDEKAAEIVTAIGQHILTNDFVKEVFPKLKPAMLGQWSQHKLFLERSIISKDPSLEASGILSTGVAGRADLLIFDDPVDYKNAIQFPSLRKTVKDSFNDVWINLLPSYGGRVIYICTPWHIDDLSMHIKNTKSTYKVCSYKIDNKLTPVWTPKWDKEALQNRLADIGTRAFDRGFKLKPLSDEETLFKKSEFEKYYNFSLKLGQIPGGLTSGWHFYSGIDLGIGKKSKSPRTCIFTFAEKKGIKLPVDIRLGRWAEPEKVRQLYDMFQKWKPEVIYVENNSYQESFTEIVAQMGHKLPVKGIYTGSQKTDLDIGLPSMAVEIENGSWIIPYFGHEDVAEEKRVCNCPVCEWLTECYSFPIGLTDALMAWWIAREGYRVQLTKVIKIRSLSSLTGVNRGTGSIKNPKHVVGSNGWRALSLKELGEDDDDD